MDEIVGVAPRARECKSILLNVDLARVNAVLGLRGERARSRRPPTARGEPSAARRDQASSGGSARMRDRLSRPDGAREQEEEGGAEEGVKVVGLSSGARHLGNRSRGGD